MNQNYATLNLWKERISRKLNAKSLLQTNENSIEKFTKSSFVDFGDSTPEFWEFLGDWRYLFRIFCILHAHEFTINLPEKVLLGAKACGYANCLDYYQLCSVKTQLLNQLNFDVHILPFVQDGLRVGNPSIYVHLDGSADKAFLQSFEGNIIRVPFGVHPRIEISKAYRYQRKILQAIDNRNVRILNACSKGSFYSDNVFLDRDLHMSPGRNQLLSIVNQQLTEIEHCILDSPRKFYRLFSYAFSKTKCILVSLTHKRSFSEWLFTLSLSDAYLCLPGRAIVTCHNVYEAMSVGTIPILQYQSWFNPPLEDGVNCFSFTNDSDIADTIRRVLNTPDDVIKKMRFNVTNYYENYLSEESLGHLEKSKDFIKVGLKEVSLDSMEYGMA
jgi:hypothetical protein